MVDLGDLSPELRSLTTEQIIDHVRRLRMSRRTIKKDPDAVEKKPRVTKPKASKKPSAVVGGIDVNNLTMEQALNLLKQLKEKGPTT